jgi:hypothetical protein
MYASELNFGGLSFLYSQAMMDRLPSIQRKVLPRKVRIVDPTVVTVSTLDIASLPVGEISYLRVSLGESALSQPISVPVIVARGTKDGQVFQYALSCEKYFKPECVRHLISQLPSCNQVLGITSSIHGNELNGIPIIHSLVQVAPHVSHQHGMCPSNFTESYFYGQASYCS